MRFSNIEDLLVMSTRTEAAAAADWYRRIFKSDLEVKRPCS